jgi:acetyl/propionyl-CoA carboxylase alpha subunit
VHRLLIANRGEIAVRIARAAAAEGMPSVAIAAADEPSAPHLAAADEVRLLPGTGPAAYLDVAAVVAAARAADCDLLHPGYGFLSENPALATACTEAGITFVGPPAGALDLFGDQVLARALAEKHGVPILRGTEAPVDPAAVEELLADAGAVLLKARAGGGGRGTRLVRRGLNVAAHWEIDDVIDPADTRRWITTLTREVASMPPPVGRVRPNVDTW